MSSLPINDHFLSLPWIPTEKIAQPIVDANCYFCTSTSVVYCCTACRVFACEECCLLPRDEPRHWLHPQHPLTMHVDHETEKGVCDGCDYVLWCHVYYECEQCVFRLCVECFRSSRTNRRPLRWGNDKRTRSHYSHVHDLTRCRFREDTQGCTCVVCEDNMCGVGYACLKCNHFIHESCCEVEPQIIEKHPLHPSHTLKRNRPWNITKCGYCKKKFENRDYPFGCEECKFYLHWQCAKVRAVKLDFHEHDLRCFPHVAKWKQRYLEQGYMLNVLPPALRCVQCDKDFDVESGHLPPIYNPFVHHHTLTLTSTMRFYASKEYYCDVCEGTRNPHLLVYCCSQCKFFAHIECALSKEECVPQFLLKNEVQEIPSAGNSQVIFYPWIHKHPLSLEKYRSYFLVEKFSSLLEFPCNMCRLKIDGPSYICEECGFWAHERCATLPENLVDHPLHLPKHTLSLVNQPGSRVCRVCRTLDFGGYSFACRACDFSIDIKCAFLKDRSGPRDRTTGTALLKEAGEIGFDTKGNPYTLNHLFHQHELSLVVFRRTAYMRYHYICDICKETCVDRLSYMCVRADCPNSHVHAACLQWPWPSVIESHPLHPSHSLKLMGDSVRKLAYSKCLACGYNIESGGWYECEMYGSSTDLKCKAVFHAQCGSSLGRLLKYKIHTHHLYYIHKAPVRRLFKECRVCNKRGANPFYRCAECDFHYHLRCLKLPRTAVHRRHIHPLTYSVSTDLGGYYCDLCEEPRDSEYPAYCCKDCNFVTHVECIASEENASDVRLEHDPPSILSQALAFTKKTLRSIM